MKTFEDCKKQVAQKHGWERGKLAKIEKMFPNWAAVFNEAAELYMQAKANEAVKEDRWKVIERLSDTDYGLNPYRAYPRKTL